MRKRVILALTLASICVTLLLAYYATFNEPAEAAAQRQQGKLLRAERAIPGHYIVVLNDEAGDPYEAALGLTSAHGGSPRHVFTQALRGFSVVMPESAAIALSRDPRVSYVEEDGEVSISATQTNATWGLDRIDQRDLPLNGTYNYNFTGSGVTAYIIDTGIRASHNEFGGRVAVGFTSINDGRGTSDCNGHGTHVAGTVGGATYGVAKDVALVPVRVLNCQGSGTTSGVIAGVDFVTSHHAAGAPAVANMSLGGSASSSLDTAVNNSINDGVTYVVAAGNSNANACNYSPARVANALTVGSTTSSDARSSFSNFGTCLDIFAPGSSITSAWHTSNTATNTISGTSMASPHVAGVAALYLQSNPSASVATVSAAIINNSTPNKVTNAGSGSPNRLLYSLLDGSSPTPTPTPEPTPTPTPTPEPTPAPSISLSVVGYKVKGLQAADLSWSGATSTNVDVFRDNVKITTTPNDGFHTDNIDNRGGGSYTYRVCETNTTTCSNNVTISF